MAIPYNSLFQSFQSMPLMKKKERVLEEEKTLFVYLWKYSQLQTTFRPIWCKLLQWCRYVKSTTFLWSSLTSLLKGFFFETCMLFLKVFLKTCSKIKKKYQVCERNTWIFWKGFSSCSNIITILFIVFVVTFCILGMLFVGKCLV